MSDLVRRARTRAAVLSTALQQDMNPDDFDRYLGAVSETLFTLAARVEVLEARSAALLAVLRDVAVDLAELDAGESPAVQRHLEGSRAVMAEAMS